MNLIMKNGIVTKMTCGNNFAYILNDNSQFLSTEYKVLHNQGEEKFVKCMKLSYNGKMQFYYLVNGYKSLEAMSSSLDIDTFMIIVNNILKNVIDVKENGFLTCQNIDISFERIYVESSTYKVKFVYLPIGCHFFQDEQSFENKLRTNLIKLISELPMLSASVRAVQLSSDLANSSFTIQDLYNQVRRNMKDSGRIESINYKNKIERLQLIALNMPNRVVFDVTKDKYIIGKNAAVVDGVAGFNKMISRIHCKITRSNGQNYIEDLQSANGTYINSIRLQPNRPYLIKNGDIVRLANSDFQVVVD